MRKLHLISCQPDDPVFLWQVAVNLHNQRKHGVSDKARVLVFLPFDRLDWGFNGKWKFLESKFPEAKFFYYEDNGNFLDKILEVQYIPLLRPYMLAKHFEEFPELSNDAIYYHDSDTVFANPPTFLEDLRDDEVNYLSYTGNRDTNYNYMCHEHFLSKEENIRKGMKREYKKVDPLSKLLSFFNLEKQFFIANKDNVGGAQYLLKDIDSAFWEEVKDACIKIRSFLMEMNLHFMKGKSSLERETNGWQSWCADMWAIQFILWKNKKTILCPPQMDFSWSTDEISNWGKRTIYHDAGSATGKIEKDGKTHLLFNKRKTEYTDNWMSPNLRMPFYDDLSFVSPEFSSSNYVKEIEATKKYLLG